MIPASQTYTHPSQTSIEPILCRKQYHWTETPHILASKDLLEEVRGVCSEAVFRGKLWGVCDWHELEKAALLDQINLVTFS